jgi:multiple sugar transport system ATP-binding protein
MTLGQRIVLMNQGVVQQVDTPMKIYGEPANRFVGSFIGSPAMNFFAGNIVDNEFQLTGGGKIPLSESLPGAPATLGVRPEDLLTNGDGLPLANVALDVVEHMGHETMVHFELAGSQHVARLSADTQARPGDKLALAVRHGAYHLFAKDEAARRLN